MELHEITEEQLQKAKTNTTVFCCLSDEMKEVFKAIGVENCLFFSNNGTALRCDCYQFPFFADTTYYVRSDFTLPEKRYTIEEAVEFMKSSTTAPCTWPNSVVKVADDIGAWAKDNAEKPFFYGKIFDYIESRHIKTPDIYETNYKAGKSVKEVSQNFIHRLNPDFVWPKPIKKENVTEIPPENFFSIDFLRELCREKEESTAPKRLTSPINLSFLADMEFDPIWACRCKGKRDFYCVVDGEGHEIAYIPLTEVFGWVGFAGFAGADKKPLNTRVFDPAKCMFAMIRKQKP